MNVIFGGSGVTLNSLNAHICGHTQHTYAHVRTQMHMHVYVRLHVHMSTRTHACTRTRSHTGITNRTQHTCATHHTQTHAHTDRHTRTTDMQHSSHKAGSWSQADHGSHVLQNGAYVDKYLQSLFNHQTIQPNSILSSRNIKAAQTSKKKNAN